MISNFVFVLNVAIFLLGESLASGSYVPTFRNSLFHLHECSATSALKIQTLCKGKGKVHPVQALRLCTGRTAHRGSWGIALPFLDHDTRMGWGVSVTPRPLFTLVKDPVSIVQEAGWALGPVWTGVENLGPTGIRSPDRPARSQSLYRLSYPAHQTLGTHPKKEYTLLTHFLKFRLWLKSDKNNGHFTCRPTYIHDMARGWLVCVNETNCSVCDNELRSKIKLTIGAQESRIMGISPFPLNRY